jgi:hypothetical protein
LQSKQKVGQKNGHRMYKQTQRQRNILLKNRLLETV